MEWTSASGVVVLLVLLPLLSAEPSAVEPTIPPSTNGTNSSAAEPAVESTVPSTNKTNTPTDVRVTCDSTSMTVYLNRTMFDHSFLPSDLHFVDESCVGYSHDGENIALYSRYDRCSCAIEENNDVIIYSNSISAFHITPVQGNEITRDIGDMQINVRCEIRRRQVLSRYYNPISSSLVIEEVGYGNFTVDFDRYTDETFSGRHPNAAAPVPLQDRLFYAVNLTTVSNLTLFINHCWSTPSADPLDQKQYDLIKDGCASDNTIQLFSNFGPSFKPFAFEAFTFIGDYSQVYIHCEVIACDETDADSRCVQGCRPPNPPPPPPPPPQSRRRRSMLGKQHGSNSQPRIVSQIVGPFSKVAKKQGVDAKTGWFHRYFVITAIAGTLCLFIGMAAMYAVMKARI